MNPNFRFVGGIAIPMASDCEANLNIRDFVVPMKRLRGVFESSRKYNHAHSIMKAYGF
jgi:hypothetical protein